jgi:hypothetical protein
MKILIQATNLSLFQHGGIISLYQVRKLGANGRKGFLRMWTAKERKAGAATAFQFTKETWVIHYIVLILAERSPEVRLGQVYALRYALFTFESERRYERIAKDHFWKDPASSAKTPEDD